MTQKFTGQCTTNEVVQISCCIQTGFPEQDLIGFEDGRLPLAYQRRAAVPKLEGRMDEDTKMTNPEIMDEGFQPIGKEDGLS